MSHSKQTEKKNILIGLTGSIACYKTCSVISQLTQLGHQCRVIATNSALQFVGPATLEGLSRTAVYSDTFHSGQMMGHIELARWADVFLVAPATANFINKMACGIGDDLLSTTLLAYEANKPLLLAPAMNSTMLSHPTVEQSLTVLKNRGVNILDTAAGKLACGEEGYGKMLDPELILEAVLNSFQKKIEGKSILITAGGTIEPIDGVRFITNLSTGQSGAELADELKRMGHHVHMLTAKSAQKPQLLKNIHLFDTFKSLEDQLTILLQEQHFDLVIHMAAVSDFYVDKIVANGREYLPQSAHKIESHLDISLHLKPNEKLIFKIKKWSKNRDVKLVGFKLTNTVDASQVKAAVYKLLHSNEVDQVVQNDLHEIDKTSKIHPFHLYDRSGRSVDVPHVRNLAQLLTTEQGVENGVMP